MVRKQKASVTKQRHDTSENEDDTKFYIKFKDPRSKSQIFYYFNEEDIFDPCIPLNHGDIVSDSTSINLGIPKQMMKTPEKKKPEPPPQKPITQRKTNLPYFEDSTLQVQTANFLPSNFENITKPKNKSVIDDSFEDVGYMTAMDIKYVPDEEEVEEEHEEEEFHELEEIVEPVKPSPKKILQLQTAIEPIKQQTNMEFLVPISLKKEEFDKNISNNECPEYKIWAETHLTKGTIPARLISPAEFRLLKKLIGIKM